MKIFVKFLCVAAVVLAACSNPRASPAEIAARPIRVTTTVGMIADLVQNIGGGRVSVTGLMGAGVDPHLYKPSARDILRLDDADIIFYGGLHLEGRMVEIFEKLGKLKPVFAVSENIPEVRLLPSANYQNAHDPHIWFDVSLWMEAARVVSDELQRLDPQHAALYQQNADAYLKKLEDLHRYTQTQINSIPASVRVLITAHDAFGYFGHQYGMEVRGLQGASTATEAGAGDVRELARFITERKIKAIFVESSVPAATVEAVQAAVQSRGWDVKIGGELFSDAMGNAGTVEGTYIGMVRHNVDVIAGALK
jgi:manganese/zinc/iron transport system substrate-binding protein